MYFNFYWICLEFLVCVTASVDAPSVGYLVLFMVVGLGIFPARFLAYAVYRKVRR